MAIIDVEIISMVKKNTTANIVWGIIMAWACMSASEIGSLVFINDLTAGGSSRMNCTAEVVPVSHGKEMGYFSMPKLSHNFNLPDAVKALKNNSKEETQHLVRFKIGKCKRISFNN